MKTRATAWLTGVLAGGLAAAGRAGAGDWPAAEQVIRAAGVPAGLAVVVGTTDGKLEAGLTNEAKMVVHGLALSAEAAAKARQHIFERKLYGLASIGEVETAATLPYYDRIVNLLVADLDALGKAAPSPAEVERVLGYEGVAYLKRGGRWTKTVKPAPKDVDCWTHYHYDASGNPVSKDLVVGPPNAFRWADGPFGMNLIGGFRTSDGVAVQINPAYLLGRPKVADELAGLRLWARDVSSGVLLWHRPVLPAGARYPYAGRYTESFVAAGGRVYIYDFTDDEKVALTALDLRTGAVRRVFDKGVVCRKADWPGSAERNADWKKWANEMLGWGMVLVHDGKVVQLIRDRIVVMDAATGAALWQKRAGNDTQYLKAAVSGDRLVALTAKIGPARQGGWASRTAELVGGEAWQWKDGAPLWRTDLSGLKYPRGHEVLFHYDFAAYGSYLLLPHEAGLILLSAADGSRVWEKPVRPMIGYHIIGDRIWLGRVGTNVFGGVLMLATGERDPTPRSGGTNQSACDAPTATLNWFMGKRNFVPVERKPDWPQWVSMRCFGKKCGERAAASYGSVFGVSPMCGCDQFIRGSGAFYAVAPAQPLPDGRRLSRGGAAAIGAVQPQLEARKAAAALFWGLPQGAPAFWFTTNFRWSEPIQHWAGYGLTRTEPVQAGDLTLVAHVHEHRLAASRGGREVWNFVAGGRIGAPPAIRGGLAIFGCCDGCVYAVHLKDGSQAWRFLAAPSDRRQMFLGQVESAGPVFNVVLDGEKLYCSAGRHEELEGGIHFYCLDAASGAVRWHVSRRRGMESDLAPYRQRKNTGDDKGIDRLKKGILSDGRAQMNDALELRGGKLLLHGVPMVDVADPKDSVMYPRTIVPPQIVSADADAGAKPRSPAQ